MLRAALKVLAKDAEARIEAAGIAPTARAEVLAVRSMPREILPTELRAPYHDSFLHWLQHGGSHLFSVWADDGA